MPTSPEYVTVPGEDPSGKETDFEKIHTGSPSDTPTPNKPSSSMAQEQEQVKSALVPIRTASANEVREYITDLLANKHNTTVEIAVEVASKWKLGRGYDFLDASSDEFNKMFGKEFGNCLYKSTAEDEWIRWNTNDLQGGFIGTQIGFGFIALLAFAIMMDVKPRMDRFYIFSWVAAITSLPSFLFRMNAPVHVRDRYVLWEGLMASAVLLRAVYAMGLSKYM